MNIAVIGLDNRTGLGQKLNVDLYWLAYEDLAKRLLRLDCLPTLLANGNPWMGHLPIQAALNGLGRLRVFASGQTSQLSYRNAATGYRCWEMSPRQVLAGHHRSFSQSLGFKSLEQTEKALYLPETAVISLARERIRDRVIAQTATYILCYYAEDWNETATARRMWQANPQNWVNISFKSLRY